MGKYVKSAKRFMVTALTSSLLLVTVHTGVAEVPEQPEQQAGEVCYCLHNNASKNPFDDKDGDN